MFIPRGVLVQQSLLTVYTNFGCRFLPTFNIFFFSTHNIIQCSRRHLGVIITGMADELKI